MKKKRKLNLGKSKIASINTMYSIKGGMTVDCNTNTCPSGTVTAATCLTNEGATTCPKTLTTRPDTDTCMGGSGTNTTNGGGTETNNTCSANLPSLNC